MRKSRIIAVIAAVLLVLGACGDDDTGATPTSGQSVEEFGSGSRSILPRLTPVAELEDAAESEAHVSYAPEVPATIMRAEQRIFDVHLEAIENVCPLDPANDITTEVWGYRIAGDDDVTCGAPGPVLRGRVGDVARITLTNSAASTHPHNIDFHAVTGQGGGAADLVVQPGESATIQVRLLYPGAFMYHCAFGDVPSHIAHGMYGMFIVDPASPLPAADHEWAVMQSEWYVSAPDDRGVTAFDRDAILAEQPRYVTFNGRTDALTGDNALRMAVGERARIYMVNQGLSLDSNFHPIGSHWDAVYAEGATHPANDPIRGSQSTLVVAGGGTVTEIVGIVPSTILLVDHALGRTFYKGALAQIVVEGEADPEVFTAGTTPNAAETPDEPEPTGDDGAAGDDGGDDGQSDDAVATSEVTITRDAFNPANADRAYDPRVIRVSAGTTVTWTNADPIGHTVTSGRSDGRVGEADGLFDSGNMNEGDDFSYTFDEPGEYPYYCIPHPWMRGTVIVE